MAERFESPSNEPLRQWFTPAVRSLQIIVFALTLGPLAFLVMVVFVIEPPQADPPGKDGSTTLTYVSLAFAVAAIAARHIVAAAIAAGGRRRIASEQTPNGTAHRGCADEPKSDGVQLYNVYMVRTIVSAAIIEGATFFLVNAFLIERQPFTLEVAAVFIAVIAAHLPTVSRVERWIEDQLQRIVRDRQLQQLHGDPRTRD